ncbi:PQQ-dependent sugar dehydrogenase [Cryobacterium frigoriphilum]|uniref:PQQ-dependent sugar dehydrogenase n=1 Tax=Cryobacterium frigoriphilum TaxID=1259150 RepID=A0A4R9A4D1_9MICO|nr:PQQ-dependent sugar dehydrogenase [Cryobacterium frigoriphilum]TFD52058.1 PQQ-dependent sugar dehydrogenase [Cryobacterium frigoriphilum]
MNTKSLSWGLLAATVAIVLGGCTVSSPAPRASSATSTPAAPRPTPSVAAPAGELPLPVSPVGDPVVIASGLAAPWSVLRLPGGGPLSGAALISERDTTLVRELLADGSLRQAGSVPDARPSGEGGLLGLAFLADAAASGGSGWVYAYFTSAADNRIERMPLLGTPGSLALGAPESVLTGIPRAGNHDGGRIAFGPDGLLYATAGDAGNTDNAQDLESLGGKILRMTPTGGVPSGSGAASNPFGTLVYSYGHRNPQGIAWDSTGTLWASEFGQNTWDELNRIEAGGNYGWPVVEGVAGSTADPAFIDPVQQWQTSEASPSGIAIVNDTLFMTGLRGARLWRIDLRTVATTVAENDPSTVTVDEWFVNSYGRLRDVVSGPAGTLWFISNNTDGRGDPTADDDRLYQVEVAP